MFDRPFLAVIISTVCLQGAPCQSGVSGDEVTLLLKLGVPSKSVLGAVQRIGGPLEISEGTLEQISKLGAEADLLNALSETLKTRNRRMRLARDFKVHRIGGTPLHILVPEKPRPWIVQRQESSRGILITLRPHDHQGRDWLTAPGIFLLVQRNTPFPVEAEPHLALRLSRIMSKRLLGWGGWMQPGESIAGRVGRRVVPQHRIEVGDPRRKFKGSLVTRTRILKDGTILLVGYGSGSSDRTTVESLFESVAETLDIPAEDL